MNFNQLSVCLCNSVCKRFLTNPPIDSFNRFMNMSWRHNLTPTLSCTQRSFVTNVSKSSEWDKAVSNAEKIVGYPTSFMYLRCLLSDEIADLAMHMRKLIGTKHPLLKTARGLVYGDKHCVQMRGLIVLLISKAAGMNSLLEKTEELEMISGINSRQRKLAEITEMIHTANLIHKGVVNLSSIHPSDETRSDMEFGNKISTLSGDFLLANACTGLARLKNTTVVEVISSAIGELMEAEFSDYKDDNGNPSPKRGIKLSDWMRQTYLSSGCLLAKSCQSSLELSGHDVELQRRAYNFGLHMAYALQLHEDLRPFTHGDTDLDDAILLSAPVIHYIETGTESQIDEILPHSGPIDCTQVFSAVKESSSVDACKDIWQDYGKLAVRALDDFVDSEAKSALITIAAAVTHDS